MKLNIDFSLSVLQSYGALQSQCMQGLFDFQNQRVHAVSVGQYMWQAKGKDAIQYRLFLSVTRVGFTILQCQCMARLVVT